MEDIDKKLKGGLKKCPGHRFGASYKKIKNDIYQCDKCKGYVLAKGESDEIIRLKKISYQYERHNYHLLLLQS